MRNVPPSLLFLLASSTAGSLAFADELSAATNAPAGTLPATNTVPGRDLLSQPVTNSQSTVEIEGLGDESEMEQSFADGITYFRRGVVVRYQTMELVANQVALSDRSGDIIADGNVRLRRDGQYWAGEHLEYNYKTGKIHAENFRAGFPPFFAGGLTLDADFKGEVYTAGDTALTTDDVKQPKLRVLAKRFQITNGDTIEARNAKLMVGETPVMVLPYYKRTMRPHAAYWQFTPGYRTYFGPYLLSSYHFPLTTNITGGAKLDLYGKRGLGVGPDFFWKIPRWGEGQFQYYYISDQDPDNDPFGQPIRNDRHRIAFSHRAMLRTNLTAKVVVREQSDPWVIRDFFETEYRKNSQPRSFLELNQLWSNWSLDLMVQPQLNEFYQTVERLPDIRLSGIRQRIGESPLYYESETSLGYFRFQPGDPNFLPFQGVGAPPQTDYSAMRGDTYHQILWPQTYFGWLNLVPRVGGRLTQYGETDGFGTTFEERTRFVFNTGAEISTKASRVWRNVESKFWDVKELRHIVEPSINYVFVPHPNYRPHELPQFDTEIPSLRLLPIEYPDYNAIDAIDSQNVLRLTLRNKLQTKREESIQNLLNWAVYTDWRLNPRDGQTTFSDVYSDLDLRPRNWLSLSSETRFDVEHGKWNAAYHTATISPNSAWSWRVGHRYFRGGPEFGPDSDNNTVFSSLFFKMNENWAARMTHHFEARDGTMEEQYYTIYRDFRNWTGALTFRVRQERTRATDYAVALTFQLKAFPRFRLGEDANEHSFLLGT